MTTVFVSDLHLSDKTPDMTRLFCHLVADCTGKADALYILGDLFDVWIGDDDPGETGKTVIAALQQAWEKGLSVSFMHGNRDFLIGNGFLKAAGCRYLADPHVLDLYGKRTLLMHGDTLCTRDTAYLKFRRWSRCWLVKKLFLLKSVAARRAIAHRYRMTSTAHTSNTATEIMDATPEAIGQVMQRHRIQQLIHGHTHRPAIHSLTCLDQPAERIVLAAWHETGGALLCRPDGSRELVRFGLPYVSLFEEPHHG